jgi:hypothetical protein
LRGGRASRCFEAGRLSVEIEIKGLRFTVRRSDMRNASAGSVEERSASAAYNSD